MAKQSHSSVKENKDADKKSAEKTNSKNKANTSAGRIGGGNAEADTHSDDFQNGKSNAASGG